MSASTLNPDLWHTLGLELLRQEDLNEIKVNNHGNVTKCCTLMLEKWMQQDLEASWSRLIEVLKRYKLNRIADNIESNLNATSAMEDIVGTMESLNVTDKQHSQAIQGKEGIHLQKESSIGICN